MAESQYALDGCAFLEYLRTRFGSTDTSDAATLLKNLGESPVANHTSMSLSSVEKLHAHIVQTHKVYESVATKLDETLLMAYFLNGLPECYAPIKLHVAKDSNLDTLDKLQAEVMRLVKLAVPVEKSHSRGNDAFSSTWQSHSHMPSPLAAALNDDRSLALLAQAGFDVKQLQSQYLGVNGRGGKGNGKGKR